jgi:hypothetical protein
MPLIRLMIFIYRHVAEMTLDAYGDLAAVNRLRAPTRPIRSCKPALVVQRRVSYEVKGILLSQTRGDLRVQITKATFQSLPE